MKRRRTFLALGFIGLALVLHLFHDTVFQGLRPSVLIVLDVAAIAAFGFGLLWAGGAGLSRRPLPRATPD